MQPVEHRRRRSFLSKASEILKRRSILFLVSDFYDDPEQYRKV